jgi:hypothetical protein
MFGFGSLTAKFIMDVFDRIMAWNIEPSIFFLACGIIVFGSFTYNFRQEYEAAEEELEEINLIERLKRLQLVEESNQESGEN